MSRRWVCIFSLFLIAPSMAPAQEAKDPLRFVPAQSEWVVKVDRPRELLQAIEKNEAFLQAQKLAGVREYYDSTNFQLLYQLLAYYEKELGMSRNELLADLAFGGIAIGARVTPPDSAVLVIQAKDEKRLRRFVDLSLGILEKEYERQESKDKIVRNKYEGFDVGQIGAKLNFAIADAALILANDDKVLKLALDARLKKKGQESVLQITAFVEARKQAPPEALAWTWFHLDEIRKYQKFKDGLEAASLDPFQVFLFGGLSNQIKRSPYVAAALTRDGADYRLGITMPRGRTGMSAVAHMILPADDNGTPPPLHPLRTISSTSYFFDLGQFWDKRIDILGAENAKGLDEADKNIAKFLGGIKLSKLLHAMGPHHRLVFAQQKERPYKIKPNTPFPAVALVADMRDASFAKDMNSIFRSAALVGTFAYGLSLKEETYKDCDMVSYYFSETKKVEGDANGIRFNFSPTYVKVGDQFVMSGTVELARDLIDVLKTEGKQKPSKATMRTQVFASGFADILRSNEDATLTQLILAQAFPPKTAKEELRAILTWLDQLGTLRLEMNYGVNDFRYDIVWQVIKQ